MSIILRIVAVTDRTHLWTPTSSKEDTDAAEKGGAADGQGTEAVG